MARFTPIPLALANHATRSSPASLHRAFSVLQRPAPNYEGHIPLTTFEKGALALGSAALSLINPHRGDLIATLGETTATPYSIYRLRDTMLSSPTGRRILRDRPRITSKTLSLPYLRSLPENSLGRTYASWLDREGVTPDTRTPVRYIDDEECAYVMQRYRECHDFYHALTGLPVWVEGEVALKAFEFVNLGLPMTGLSLAAVGKLNGVRRERFWRVYLPWAVQNGSRCESLVNVYWEEELERDVDELRGELGVERPRDLREIRRAASLKRRRREREKEMANAT